jgi:hypothetical protein
MCKSLFISSSYDVKNFNAKNLVMRLEYHSFFWRIQMIPAARPVTTTYSFSEGATTFSITQKLRNLITAIANVFDRIFRFLLPFLYSKKAVTQPIANEKVSQAVVTPAAKTVAQVATAHIVTKPSEKTTSVQPIPRLPSSAPTYPSSEIGAAPASVPAVVALVEASPSAPVVSMPASQPEASAPVVVAAAPEPAGPTLAGVAEPREAPYDDAESIAILLEKANNVVVQDDSDSEPVPQLLDDPAEDAIMVSPQGPRGSSGPSGSELDETKEDNETPTDDITRFVRDMRAKATPVRNAILDQNYPLVTSPRAQVKPIQGSQKLAPESRAAIAILVEGMPSIADKILKNELVITKFLNDFFERGLKVGADYGKDEDLPFETAPEQMGFEKIKLGESSEFVQVGRSQELVSLLKEAATRQNPLVGALLFEGNLLQKDPPKNPKIYGVFAHQNEEGVNRIYLLDLYGKNKHTKMSWRLFKNEVDFSNYLAPVDYSVIAMAKKSGEPKK